MWAGRAWATVTWATAVATRDLPPGWTDIPPPIPGSTSTAIWVTGRVWAPWAMRSWAGLTPVVPYTGGGITAAPDPDRGVMQLWAWWPDAATIQVLRVGSDGTRVPVRGAYGLQIGEETRLNLNPNPSFEAGLNGYLPINAETTLTSTADAPWVVHGATAMRMTSTTTTTGAAWPGSLPGGSAYTLAVNLGLSSAVTAVTVAVAWLNSSGGGAGTTNLTLTADQLSAAVGQSSRAVWTFTAPAGAVTGSVALTITGLPVGQHADLDAIVVERGTTAGGYYDGDSLGGWWTGTRHLSTTVFAPVQSLLDPDCPLDVAVSYEVHHPGAGARMLSPAVVLESRGRTWLTHPLADLPVLVDLRAVPDEEHGVELGVFRVLDRARPIVVTGAMRHAPTGTLAINAISAAEKTTLMGLLAKPLPVLLRAPADYYVGEGAWYSLGSISVSREGRKAWQDAWLLTAPYYEVDAPDPALVA